MPIAREDSVTIRKVDMLDVASGFFDALGYVSFFDVHVEEIRHDLYPGFVHLFADIDALFQAINKMGFVAVQRFDKHN